MERSCHQRQGNCRGHRSPLCQSCGEDGDPLPTPALSFTTSEIKPALRLQNNNLPPIHELQVEFSMGQKYFGLRGNRLVHFMIATVVAPTYFLLGYNNGVFGGLLTLKSFVGTFSGIDTIHPEGNALAENARVQGTCNPPYLFAYACSEINIDSGT